MHTHMHAHKEVLHTHKHKTFLKIKISVGISFESVYGEDPKIASKCKAHISFSGM